MSTTFQSAMKRNKSPELEKKNTVKLVRFKEEDEQIAEEDGEQEKEKYKPLRLFGCKDDDESYKGLTGTQYTMQEDDI